MGGKIVGCSSGTRPGTWFADYKLRDFGNTNASFLVISYNPIIFSLPSHVALFWMGHECGHAFNRTAIENVADCWSAKTGVQEGWFNLLDYDELARELINNPGDNTHPVGAERLKNIKACMQAAKSGTTID